MSDLYEIVFQLVLDRFKLDKHIFIVYDVAVTRFVHVYRFMWFFRVLSHFGFPMNWFKHPLLGDYLGYFYLDVSSIHVISSDGYCSSHKFIAINDAFDINNVIEFFND